ncbi:MAG TPA: right-handed parallel beta-helix repeat-containing protein [Solirubrobacteraceae bacterium]|nr:right-handed parallel beta-helix repeat-containing protein [Solirubrobacteraceae bacterium]
MAAAAAPAWSSNDLVCSSGCPFNSIQAAINAVTPGTTITIGSGEYFENIVVGKSVTLKGSGNATVIYPSISTPECSPGSLCEGTASNIILVQANDVTITKLHLDGNNPHLTSGVIRGGQDIDARNGIIVNFEQGVYNDLTVSKVKVSNIYLRGIYASSGGTFNFNHDVVENVQGEEESIAMFNFGGSGEMAHNRVTDANDAISANWSTGTRFIDNTIAKSGSGLHTDNNGGGGGDADLIKGNRVRECSVNGYGIFVFVPYVSATVESNKISACSVGLAAFGGAMAGEGPTFADNSVNGTGAATSGGGTYGAYLTTDQLGYEYGELTATFRGDKFEHFDTGMLVTQTSPTPGQPAGDQATVTASTDDSFEHDGTGVDGEPGTVVNAQEDWWGCAQGPNMGGHCNTALGTVTYTPWLTSAP